MSVCLTFLTMMTFLMAVAIGACFIFGFHLSGNTLPKWATPLILIAAFSIADTLVKKWRHSPKRPKQVDPIKSISRPAVLETKRREFHGIPGIKSISRPAVLETSIVNISPPPTPPAIEHAKKVSPVVAGELLNGVWMIDPSEVARILQNHEYYHNVFLLEKPPAGGLLVEQKFYLVLGQGSGVFIIRSTGSAWSIKPEGVTFPLSGLKIQSVDGRNEAVEFTDPTQSSCIRAWVCNSYQSFKANADWGLFHREFMSGKSVASFLRWSLPYQNLTDGLNEVCQSPEGLERLARFLAGCNPTAVDEKLMSLGLRKDHPLYSALAGKRAIRNNHFGLMFTLFLSWIFGSALFGFLASKSGIIPGETVVLFSVLLGVSLVGYLIYKEGIDPV